MTRQEEYQHLAEKAESALLEVATMSKDHSFLMIEQWFENLLKYVEEEIAKYDGDTDYMVLTVYLEGQRDLLANTLQTLKQINRGK